MSDPAPEPPAQGPPPAQAPRPPRDAEPTPEELAGAQRVVRRRAPRYRVLVTLGALVGAVAAVVLTAFAVNTETYSTASVLGYLLAALVLLGGLLGGLVGVLLDRGGRRR